MPRSWFWGSILLLALASCGDDDNGSPHEDAGSDAGGSSDAGRDAGDAGRDAGRDAGPGPDAGSDSGTPLTDAGGMDAATDAAASDSGTPSTDSGNLDASDLDATASDAGESDASESDASESDASASDASELDGSSTGDAATEDSGGDGETADAGPTETFAAIYDGILGPACAGCHNGPGHTSMLDLSSRNTAYTALYNVDAAGSGCGTVDVKRVLPGDADMSLLVQKLELSSDQVCGNHMPRPPVMDLTTEQISRIRTWIDEGAPE